MNLLKNIFLGIFFLYAMYWGGIGTQSNSAFAQGMGFMSVVMALGSLYILYRLIPKVLSSATTVLIIVVICVYSAYCLGFFNGKSVSEFLTGQSVVEEEYADQEDAGDVEESDDVSELSQEMFGGKSGENKAQKKKNKGLKLRKIQGNKRARPQPQSAERRQGQQAENSGGLIGKMKTMLFGSDTAAQQPSIADINPFDYPSIKGEARVITGSLINVDGITVKLFGIAAPDLQQTCANKHGYGYHCGRKAATWLQDWLGNREVTCYILGNVVNNRTTGACFTDNNKYDLAAVVTNAGWAVAYTKNTQIYIPYEQQAADNRRGLWEGEFYKPWDWEKIQNRKVEIHVTSPEPISDSADGWGFNMNMFKGLF
ncbi:MAG: thermonuclease family protein [Alphaproteobacteria bacterium]|nr:thermonuclease family protein [Alphaproteobacteria bacterium]